MGEQRDQCPPSEFELTSFAIAARKTWSRIRAVLRKSPLRDFTPVTLMIAKTIIDRARESPLPTVFAVDINVIHPILTNVVSRSECANKGSRWTLSNNVVKRLGFCRHTRIPKMIRTRLLRL